MAKRRKGVRQASPMKSANITLPPRTREANPVDSSQFSPTPARKVPASRLTKANLIFALIGVEGGIAFGIGFLAQPLSDWSDPSLAITALSRIAAMMGTYFALVCLVFVARIPWLEKQAGQDRLVKWHRKLAPYSLYLVFFHVLLVSFGYGALDAINAWSEFWRLTLTMGWMLPAFFGFISMMMVGVTSYKRARSKMKYETWWQIHLFSYLAIALGFMHQIEMGTMFVNNEAMKMWWISLYVLVFGFIIGFRIIVPLVRSMKHELRVHSVIRESHDTVSVVMSGRNLSKLDAQGGQFFAWRFLGGSHWFEAHPYSLSAAPRNDQLRITVKNLGDHSAWLAKVKPGSRVMFEGPYGVFTAEQSKAPHAVLIAGGVGITPVRALLEELPTNVVVDVIWRASADQDLVLREEVEALADWRGATIHYMVGSRKQFPLSPGRLKKTVPHIVHSDVFLCGPNGLVEEAVASCRELGLKDEHIHDEAFAY
jgi:predicted ferric reductase